LGRNGTRIATNLAGQGLLIVVFEELKFMFVAWFTYDTERPLDDVMATLGEPGHRWLPAQGTYFGASADLDIFLTQGGVFDRPQPAPGEPMSIGGMSIIGHDSMNTTMIYTMNDPPVQGSMELNRIVRDKQALCQQLSGVE